MLSDRRQRVLSALIEEYIARALPVGSRTLVERYKLGVSSATVRNELSVLEDDGYIVQPHTSAGRIPTDIGYRTFVDDLLSSGIIEESKTQEDMIDELQDSAAELDLLLEKTSAALAHWTDCLSVVLAPSVVSLNLKQISLISLNDHQALVLVITEDGQVLKRPVDFAEVVTSEELAQVQNLLNENLSGQSFMNLEGMIDKEFAEIFEKPLTKLIIEEVVSCLQESQSSRAHRLGASALLKKPEFSRAASFLPIMQMLEDDSVLFHILEEEFADEKTIVKIGREHDNEGLSALSVVASQYGKGDAFGIVAVIGPTRMDYSKVISAVQAAQQVLHNS